MDDLHPYDGKVRRFRDTDTGSAAIARGRGLVASLLRLPAPPPAEGLRYDLSFDSGGCGVFDRLHAAFRCAPDEAAAIAARAGFLALTDPWQGDDRESLEWLVHLEDLPEATLADAVAVFLAEQRAAFQPAPGDPLRVWIEPGSDVNHWTLIYAAAGELAYIGFDQG